MRISNNMTNTMNMKNVNVNKEHLDTLNTQLSSRKKISRPSDDPSVAISSLGYRATLTEISQYYERNTEDAEAWLKTTQDAIDSVNTMLSDVKSIITGGANGTNTIESRKAILEELEGLKKQIYDNGNADYAGRYVFTGWRTSTSLTFLNTDDKNVVYQDITQHFSADDMEKATYVKGKTTVSTSLPTEAASFEQEQQVDVLSPYRIRLAYDKLDYDPGSISINGTTITPKVMSVCDEAYDPDATVGSNGAILIPETGELILGSDLAKSIMESPVKGDIIEVKYNKSSWEEGDLRPEHYFDCREVKFGADASKSLTSVIGSGNITTTGDLDKDVTLDGSYNVTDKASGIKSSNNTYPAATINFGGLGSLYQLEDLDKTGFDSICNNGCGVHYSIQFVSGTKGTDSASASGYQYSLESNAELRNLCINIDSLKANGVTSGADLANALIEIFSAAGQDNHRAELATSTNPAAADYGVLYLFDNTTIDKSMNARFYTEPFAPTTPERIEYLEQDKAINYEVSSNQTIQVNTYASQLYLHDIGRDIDELILALSDTNDAAGKVSTLEKMLEDPEITDTQRENLETSLDAAKKEYDLVLDKLQKMFEKEETNFNDYIQKTTEAGTDCGTKTQRLLLVQNRLLTLQTTTEEMASKNENVEFTNVAVQINEAEKVYQGALQAIGKITQQNLLNYL